jgi:translation initiation factor 2B subunit (eIF-2B alpha/beta/delta family)
MPSVQEYLSQMRVDLVHGSGWYFEKISELLSGIGEEDLPALSKSLPSIRPGMASISNICELLETKDEWSTEEARGLGRKLSEFKALLHEGLRRQARGMKVERAITISYSKAVELFLMEARVENVTLIQSRPGN